jgi:hypothetical protein
MARESAALLIYRSRDLDLNPVGRRTVPADGLKVDQAASTRASLADFIGVFASLIAPSHSVRRHFMSRFVSCELPRRESVDPPSAWRSAGLLVGP